MPSSDGDSPPPPSASSSPPKHRRERRGTTLKPAQRPSFALPFNLNFLPFHRARPGPSRLPSNADRRKGEAGADAYHLPPLKPAERRCLNNLAGYTPPRWARRIRDRISTSPSAPRRPERERGAGSSSSSHMDNEGDTSVALPLPQLAAVLVALFVGRSGDLYVLLSRRSDNMRSFAGDTSLPGGKVEIGDRGMEDTAVRIPILHWMGFLREPCRDVKHLKRLVSQWTGRKFLCCVFWSLLSRKMRSSLPRTSWFTSCPYHILISFVCRNSVVVLVTDRTLRVCSFLSNTSPVYNPNPIPIQRAANPQPHRSRIPLLAPVAVFSIYFLPIFAGQSASLDRFETQTERRDGR